MPPADGGPFDEAATRVRKEPRDDERHREDEDERGVEDPQAQRGEEHLEHDEVPEEDPVARLAGRECEAG